MPVELLQLFCLASMCSFCACVYVFVCVCLYVYVRACLAHILMMSLVYCVNVEPNALFIIFLAWSCYFTSRPFHAVSVALCLLQINHTVVKSRVEGLNPTT